MRTTTFFAALAGLTLAGLLIAMQDVQAVVGAYSAAGLGLAVVAIWHGVPMLLDTLGWRALLASGKPAPALSTLLLARWIREGVDNLLPVAQVGGEVVGGRLLVLHGVPGAIAAASLLVDVTLAVCSQLVFTCLGLLFLYWLYPDSGLLHLVSAALAIGVGCIAAFIAAQRGRVFGRVTAKLMDFIGPDAWASVTQSVRRLDDVVRDIYAAPARWSACLAWQMMSWVAGAGEIWLALHFIGHPVSVGEALMIESLVQAVRSTAFLVPGALGVQEGAYLLLGQLVGINAEVALALALIRRTRELTLGVPALLAWQVLEGRVFSHKRRHATPAQARDSG